VGGIAIRPGSTRIIPSVGLNEKDAELLKFIQDKGIEVFFQNIPSSEKVSLNDAIKKMGK
jgi:PTS system mannose-specific IIB component/D-glucosaminate-specific PTS system IIB component